MFRQHQNPNANEMKSISESAPLAQIARFGDWQALPGGFEMAYKPATNDHLEYTLSSSYRPGPHDVPFSGVPGNGIDGRLYGNNTIPVAEQPAGFCSTYINSCQQ